MNVLEVMDFYIHLLVPMVNYPIYFGASCAVDNYGFGDSFGGDSACKDDDDDCLYIL